MKFYFLFFIIVFISELKALEFEPIYKVENGMHPRIGLVNDKLIIADMTGKVVTIRPIDKLDEFTTVVKGSGGITNLAIHESGWVAVSMELGHKIAIFHVDNPHKVKTIKFSKNRQTACNGLDLYFAGENKYPFLWMGSNGDMKILLIDPWIPPIFSNRGYIEEDYEANFIGPKMLPKDNNSKLYDDIFETGLLDPWKESNYRILKKYDNISGPFYLKAVNDNIFTLNGFIYNFQALPLVFNWRKDNTLLGDKRGIESNTKLERKYASNIVVDKPSNSVFYFNGNDRQLLRIPINNPSELSIKMIDIKTPFPRDISRYKEYLLILGRTFIDNTSKSGWSILKDYGDVRFKEIKTIPLQDSPLVNNSIYQVVDKRGNLYLSSSFGVILVRGIFYGLE